MKKITLLVFLITTFLGFSQQVVVQNFDTPGTFNISNSFAGLAATIEADPAASGRLNGLQMVSVSTGETYQGVVVAQTATGDKYKLTTDKTMSIDVYSTQAFTLLAKVENGTGPNSGASASYTTPNAWQTITFTFTQSLDNTGIANGIYPNLTLFPNWSPNNSGFLTPQNFTVYVDNITSEIGVVPPDPQPATAAPTPPARPAADVKSIFSNAYTNVATLGYTAGDNTYNTDWCGATTTLVSIQGNDTNKVTGLGCEGISFLNGRFDATSFTKLHIDVWTPTPTQDKVLTIKLSNWNNTGGETSAIIIAATNAPPALLPTGSEGTWIPMDIPLSSFVGASAPPNLSRNDIVQLVLEGNLGVIYYDNLYLHKDTVLSNTGFDLVTFKVYPNPSSNNVNISSSNTIENVSLYSVLGQEILTKNGNSNEMNVDISNLQKGVYLLKAQIEGQVKTTRIVKE